MATIKKQRKPGCGQRKRETIKKIEDKASLQVTFSKRKNGLFKKASELSVVCGAQVALILFSPAGKAFTCGHPTPDHIIDRFLNNETGDTDDLSKIHKGDELYLCQQRYMEAQKELDAEKKRGEILEALVNPNEQFQWDAYIDGLSLEELEKMRCDMEQLKKIVQKRCDEVMGNVDSSSWLTTVPEPDVNTVGADGNLSNVASSSWWLTVPESDVNAVGGANDSFDFVLDGQPSNAASSSNSSAPDADVNTIAADGSFDFVLDVNPVTLEDPLYYLNIDYSNLLEYEYC
ncbi:hypothetical protein MKW94_015188 [Papaver nudicaule]|uniref:MADS-box domain-containing protein n=1 Tax=Papaver nudicaule TaxID=74823 RepID=A0AA41S520_PAPNU|nr:hypothetical protein [Papaver nudicaule]